MEAIPKRRAVIFGIVIALALTGIVLLAVALRHPRQLRLVALDIGQGDAIFVEAANGKQMLIDGGSSNAVLDRLGRAMPLFDRTIDVVIATHPDADHITGLVEVLRRYHVGMFVYTGVKGSTAVYARLLQEVQDHHIPVHIAVAGDTFPLSSDTTFTLLWPQKNLEGTTPENTNDTSIVGRLTYETFSAMLTGDAPADVEHAIVQSKATLRSTILKAGHHGSRTSSSAEFLDAVRPERVVLSVGAKNRYGHPHKEVLDALEKRHIVIDRTDEQGDVVYQSDGKVWTVNYGLHFEFW